MIILGIILLLLLLLGMPLAFAIAISSMTFFIINPNISLAIAVQKMASSTQSYPMMAIPFFILAGNLMNSVGITERLMKFCIIATRHMTGGLGHVTILLSAFMGGISGSAIADVGMQSHLLGPSMLKKGYSKGFSASIISLSGLITATIPPSVGLILFGFVGEVSIGRLFLAGIIPGILMTIFLMIAVWFVARHKGYNKDIEPKASLKQVLFCFWETRWAVLFPFILILGIRFGLFTPSEAGAFAVVYALFIGAFVYKELSFEKFKIVLKQSIIDIGVILYIIAVSAIFGYVIVYYQVPQKLAAILLGMTTNPHILILVILAFLFFIGMFMESSVNVLLLTPIFLPIVKEVGIDPVHFGILMMTLVTMGAMTPPVGIAMFTACSIIECPTEEYIIESIPFIIAILLLVLLLLYVPQLVLWLPDMVFG